MVDIGLVRVGKTLVNEMLQLPTPLIIMQVQGQMGVVFSMGADGQWEQVAP
ncbi:hypothetical protein PPUJ13061_26530 [Pseudomonas putida]|nr:hypothetical protein PPUJ13061_26530 [Pseudomonas putida]